MDKVTGQCPQTTIFLKRKESRTEVLPLTSLTPYPLGQTGSHVSLVTGHNALNVSINKTQIVQMERTATGRQMCGDKAVQ